MAESGSEGSGEGVPPVGGAALVGVTVDGRYRIESVLGEGGMGLVYKAIHTTLGKPLAVKVLRAEVSRDEEIVARFRQEAQSASNIGNQHIIDISDFGVLPDGSTYFVMEFLDGQSLTDALEGGPFPLERTIAVTKQLCSALGAAHSAGIVHRDMKPDNVQLIERGGNTDFVKVLDFGIAKVGGSNSKLTQAGKVFGTPHYMSPEQCAGSGVDHRTDIYAVGVILYEMVTGKVPFDADTLMGILTKHMYEAPVPPREVKPLSEAAPEISLEMEQVVLRCLLKDPDARYQTLDDLSDDLTAVGAGQTPKAAHMPTPAPPAPPSSGFVPGVGSANPDPTSTFADGGSIPAGVPGASRGPLFVGIGVACALIVGALMMFSGEPEKVTNELAPSPVEPTPQPEEKVEQPATAQVTVVVTSIPEGADVYRGGEFVGATPYSMTRPEGDDRVSIELRLDGYRTGKATVSGITGATLPIRLKKAAKVRKSSKSGKRRPKVRTPKKPAAKPPTAADRPAEAPRKRRMQTDVLDPWG